MQKCATGRDVCLWLSTYQQDDIIHILSTSMTPDDDIYDAKTRHPLWRNLSHVTYIPLKRLRHSRVCMFSDK